MQSYPHILPPNAGHCLNSTEDQVIFHDNDFEIFTNPDGTTHYYKEYVEECPACILACYSSAKQVPFHSLQLYQGMALHSFIFYFFEVEERKKE